jgi:hypothetical protein
MFSSLWERPEPPIDSESPASESTSMRQVPINHQPLNTSPINHPPAVSPCVGRTCYEPLASTQPDTQGAAAALLVTGLHGHPSDTVVQVLVRPCPQFAHNSRRTVMISDDDPRVYSQLRRHLCEVCAGQDSPGCRSHRRGPGFDSPQLHHVSPGQTHYPSSRRWVFLVLGALLPTICPQILRDRWASGVILRVPWWLVAPL